MTILPMPRRTLHVGVALDEGTLVAALPGDADVPTFAHQLVPRASPDGVWPDLPEALTALRAWCEDASTATSTRSGPRWTESVLNVALLPALAHTRRVELPGLRVGEARQVCAREPSRYLPVPPDGPDLVLAVEGTGWRQSSPFTVVAAHRSLLEGIGDAARESGWRVAEIVPACAAWAAASTALLPSGARGEGTLIVPLADHLEIIGVRDRELAWRRRLPTSASAIAPWVWSTIEGLTSGPTVVLGTSSISAELRERLVSDAVASNATDVATWQEPAEVAARFVRGAVWPTLLPEAEQRRNRTRALHVNAARFAAAALLLVASGAVSAWGNAREARNIAAARARIRAEVAEAIARRDSLTRAEEELTTLRRSQLGAPRWSALIASLATVLPEDAFLISLRADGDSVRLEGSATQAALVFDAIGKVRGVGAMRPSGPIRQELQPDGGVRERFALSAPLERGP